MFKKKLRCKIFTNTLMSESLESQLNKFFENNDVEIEYLFKEAESITLIYRLK